MKFLKVDRNNGTFSTIPLHSDLKTEIVEYINYGKDSFFIITKRNSIFVYGFNFFGQLGIGTNINLEEMVKLNYNLGEIKYIASANNFTIIVNKFNEFYYAGEMNRVYNNYTFKKFNPVRNLTTIKFIRTFGNNCFIVTKENLIYCIGYNANGLLG